MRRRREPENESSEHWRLKRIARHALADRGCWAVALEMPIYGDYAENVGRSVVDALGVGRVRIPGDDGRVYLGIFAAEAKASLRDLRAGMVVKGAHRHYAVVPTDLAAAAKEILPAWVGILAIQNFERIASGRAYARRGARFQDDACLPLWRVGTPAPGDWGKLLLHMASTALWALRGWRYG